MYAVLHIQHKDMVEGDCTPLLNVYGVFEARLCRLNTRNGHMVSYFTTIPLLWLYSS